MMSLVKSLLSPGVKTVDAAAAWGKMADQGAAGGLAPPFGVILLDLPARLPLPAKITIEILPPIDLVERSVPEANHEQVYEEVTDEMQETRCPSCSGSGPFR
jgi:hypothetical protein